MVQPTTPSLSLYDDTRHAQRVTSHHSLVIDLQKHAASTHLRHRKAGRPQRRRHVLSAAGRGPTTPAGRCATGREAADGADEKMFGDAGEVDGCVEVQVIIHLHLLGGRIEVWYADMSIVRRWYLSYGLRRWDRNSTMSCTCLSSMHCDTCLYT